MRFTTLLALIALVATACHDPGREGEGEGVGVGEGEGEGDGAGDVGDFFQGVSGLWSGPANETPLGNFPLLNMDVRDVDGRTLFAGIASPMVCTRYHSLIVAEEGLPDELEISARTVSGEAAEAGKTSHAETTIMALRHRQLPIEGVQFHPESVLTVEGRKIVANFLRM